MFACALALVATDVAADQLTKLIGSKNYWSVMDWGKAEQSRVWTLSGWAPFKGGQDAGRTFTKERPVEIDGKNFRANLIVEDTPARQNVLSIVSIELSPNECQQFESWLTQKFGKPKHIVDGSYQFDLVAHGNTVEDIDKMSQWDIGSTRATFTCAGLKTAAAEKAGEKNKLAAILVFGSKARQREIRPLFGLRCTQRIEYIGIDRPPEVLDDLAIIIDENRKRVRASNKRPLPGELRMTNDAIEIEVKKDDRTVEYSIDRHTGAFKAELRYPKGGGADIVGHCEKTNPEQRKF